MKYFLSTTSLILLAVIISACNIDAPDVNTPTPEILISETPTDMVSPSPTASPTSSVTPTADVDTVPVVVASPLPTQDPFAPDADGNVNAPTPEPTQGACPAVVQEGETLTIAINRNLCGNAPTIALIDAVVQFNENITNADFVSPGLEFFVPLPTATSTPEGLMMTETAAAERGISVFSGSGFPANQEFGCHDVEEGDTAVDIAGFYATTLEVLSPLNPSLAWGGCDFTNPSGGPSCNPGLRIGTCVTVPLPTSTPIPTTTPSGRETATPTPTHEPATVISPPNGAIASSQPVTLSWVSVGILRSDEQYLIDIEDRTAGRSNAFATRNTNYILPNDLIPTDGQTHDISWRVYVARQNPDGTFSPVGGVGEWNSYQWQSR
ncbi:MAG: hypothetical protein AAFQ52_00070 [Chloroflexota bacterium]